MPTLRSYPNASIRWRWNLSEPITWFRPWSVYSNILMDSPREQTTPSWYFNKEMPKLVEWLNTNIGKEGKAWGVNTSWINEHLIVRYVIFFRTPEQHMRFVLRWRLVDS